MPAWARSRSPCRLGADPLSSRSIEKLHSSITMRAWTVHTIAIQIGVTTRSWTTLSRPPELRPSTPVSMCTSIP
jgi:hypothetical protein